MLSVVCWKWGGLFGPEYVNRLHAALERHLHLPHELVCVTDDPVGLDADVRVVEMPARFSQTPRCRRRMVQYGREFRAHVQPRMLAIDLDVVVVGDLTPIVNRPEPIVCWRVRHAGVYSGSFVLCNTGALDAAWVPYRDDPVHYPTRVQSYGVPSDQAMLNFYLRRLRIPFWTEADGFVTYFGDGYERFEHLGVGPNQPQLPAGARIVVLGSADKAVMDDARCAWVREHWGEPLVKAVA